MEWYKKCWQKYADFTGRARRAEYWNFYLFTMLSFLVAGIIDMVLGVLMTLAFDASFPIFTVFIIFVSIIPTLAVAVRRLHDTNRSGWYYFISLIPFVGGIILFIALVEDGTDDKNKYGENPKDSVFKEKQLEHEKKIQERKLETASVFVTEEIVPRIDKDDHSRFMPKQG